MTNRLRLPILLCVSLITSLAISASLRLRLGTEGDIHGWLVAGPYPNEGALQLKGTGFRTDYLGGEADADPYEGRTDGAFSWKLALGNRNVGLNLKEACPTNEPAIAYCFTTLFSPTDQEATLRFGSDDGARVYVNGKSVFSKQIARGVKRDEENVPIHLVRGANRLLFKIEQGDGGWGLMARLVDRNDRPLENVHELLKVEKDSTRESFVRQFADSDTPFDVAAWQNYVEIRQKATRWIRNLRDRATQPTLLESALTNGPRDIGKAGCDVSKANLALNQAEASIRKAYSGCREPFVAWAQNPGPLLAADAAKEDFITVLKEGRYFAHASGKPFIPVGYNHNPDWPELEQSDPLRDDYDPIRTDRWFKKLQDNGVNVVRLMVETPPSGNIEEKVGTFRPEHIVWLDSVVTLARKHGVRLWITPYDTFWMSLRADASPYWAANGGPISKPIDFLTKREIIDAQKRRMKLLIDRYGNLDTVFAWEIMNEIDIWWNANPEQIRDWTNEMSKYVRDYQRQRWGRDHLVTISMAEPMPKGLNAETAFRRPDFDFATMHLYIGKSRGKGIDDIDGAARDFASGVHYAREQLHDNRPVLDGESGPIDQWIPDVNLDDRVFHRMSWAHLLAGGAGPGTRWPYRNPHHITEGMLKSLKGIRAFCDEVDWKGLTGKTQQIETSGAKIDTFATEKALIAWVRDATKTCTTFKLNGKYRYRIFNISAGKWIGKETAGEGELKLQTPTSEFAIWVAMR